MSIFRIAALALVFFTSGRIVIMLLGISSTDFRPTALEMPLALDGVGTTQERFEVGKKYRYVVDILIESSPSAEDKPIDHLEISRNLDFAWRVFDGEKVVGEGASWEKSFTPIIREGFAGLHLGEFYAEAGTQYLVEIKNYKKIPEWQEFSPRLVISIHPDGLEADKNKLNGAIIGLLLSLLVLAYTTVRDRKGDSCDSCLL
ncbi:MAG: hypothetical protein KKE17_03350 [Proteobacteria bacterium]|nr:hypothetical protein [Pseudomonadota bacterium]MBU1709020.1 hypothetical protein [Pseudomonadota bacterium]